MLHPHRNVQVRGPPVQLATTRALALAPCILRMAKYIFKRGEALWGKEWRGWCGLCFVLLGERQWFLLSMDVLLYVKQGDFSGRTILPCVGLSRECSQLGTAFLPLPPPAHPTPSTKCQSHSQPLDNPDTPTHFQPPSGWKLLMSSWYSLLGHVMKTATDAHRTLLK